MSSFNPDKFGFKRRGRKLTDLSSSKSTSSKRKKHKKHSSKHEPQPEIITPPQWSFPDPLHLDLETKDTLLDHVPLHSLELPFHDRAVVALAFSKAGNRLYTGTRDCTVALWDFGGMVHSRPFRTTEILQGESTLRRITADPSGGSFLVVPDCMQPTLLSKDGSFIAQMPRGYPYRTSMKTTGGHTAPVRDVAWTASGTGEPDLGVSQSQVASVGADGTIRFWDPRRGLANKNTSVYEHHTSGIQHSDVQCVDFQGDTVVAVSGKELIFVDRRRPFRCSQKVQCVGLTGTCAVRWVPRSGRVVTRSEGGVLLWDTRSLTTPCCGFTSVLPPLAGPHAMDITCDVDTHACLLAIGEGPALPPPSMLLPDPEAAELSEDNTPVLDHNTIWGNGVLRVLDVNTLQEVWSCELEGKGAVTSVAWHASTSQLAVGTSRGHVSVRYDPPPTTTTADVDQHVVSKTRLVGAALASTRIVPVPEEDTVVRSRALRPGVDIHVRGDGSVVPEHMIRRKRKRTARLRGHLSRGYLPVQELVRRGADKGVDEQ